jgi:D-alanyl-lipoteichoic acid acyltransferase DltB (MBOAT superfamily)
MPKQIYETKKIGGKHMLFNSINFLIFFPAAVLSYYIVPYKIRYIWLLVVSYFFYYCFNSTYVVLLAASTVITYVGGLLLSRDKEKKAQEEQQDTTGNKSMWSKVIVAFSFLTHLGMLFFFKYFDFVLSNLFAVINAVDPDITKPGFNLLLPAGISFYTFKALSYIMDVYRGDIKAERNPLKYGLYLSFFPQLAAGPIERASNF